MKKTLLFFCFCTFFILSYFGRYQPVSLDLKQPSIKTIEIKGAVKNPGVYTLKWDGTLQEGIEQAGGLLEDADTDALSLVEHPQDQEVIVIPTKKEKETKISLNQADIEELKTLPGIGPSIAQRIIEYRKDNPFSSIEQIKEVKGIGEKLFEKIKDDIKL